MNKPKSFSLRYKTKKLSLVLISLMIIAYPFIVYFGLHYLNLRYVLLLIVFCFFGRLWLLKGKAVNRKNPLKLTTIVITIIGIIICLIGIISHNIYVAKLYPIMVNGLFLSLFAYSLVYPPTVIERLARLTDPHLPDKAIHYTYKVTIVWCVFFILNGTVSLYTLIFCSTAVWALYNGLIAYLLIGLLMTIELIVRFFVKNKL